MRILILILVVSNLACKKPPIEELAYVPEYFDALDFSGIKTLEPQPIINQGTILQQGNYLFINDRKRGIHVLDNTTPGNPFYMYFWNIPGNQRFTLNGNYLYADNGPHLLIINITDFENIQYESYTENVFYENMREQFPEEALSNEYFACPDPDQGLVKSWQREVIENPNCQKL